MMAAVAARELGDGEVVFVGIGLPNLACNLARGTHAPHLVLIYESGAVGARPGRAAGGWAGRAGGCSRGSPTGRFSKGTRGRGNWCSRRSIPVSEPMSFAPA